MKILWLCNIMLPMIAEHYHRDASNKEGWLSGLASVLLARKEENGVELAIAYPAPADLLEEQGGGSRIKAEILWKGAGGSGEVVFLAYGFREDTTAPHCYDGALEESLDRIVRDFQPDVVHCFGTEYPHTLALCRVFPEKERILVGIQGLCSEYAKAYYADLPERVIRSITFRDWLKKDDLRRQREKFRIRGEMELEAIGLAGNITGRTHWDKKHTVARNPEAVYYFLNETLRPVFYSGSWEQENCEPHTIFLSQGDYPIKGLHYMLLALPRIREKYSDVKVRVAGNSIVEYRTLKDKIKISAYGRYLRRLIRKGGLADHVEFLGRLNADEMKREYLRSHLFVCCSSAENSPNSLGEAMILGVPCVAADVGGIATIFHGGQDGILYEGYQEEGASDLGRAAGNLADAVLRIWDDPDRMRAWCENAKVHATQTHDKEKNYLRLMEIYAGITGTARTGVFL